MGLDLASTNDLTAAVLWFRVPIRGNVPLLLGFSILYVFASCGIGLVNSAIF